LLFVLITPTIKARGTVSSGLRVARAIAAAVAAPVAMDLGELSEEVLDIVQTLCGDTFVETHEQAADVLAALFQKPERNERELAAWLGVTFEQLVRCRAGACSPKTATYSSTRVAFEDGAVPAELCRMDAIYTWNVLIQRINQASHWQTEYQELVEEAAGGAELEDGGLDNVDIDDTASVASVDTATMSVTSTEMAVPASTRAKTVEVIVSRLATSTKPSSQLVHRVAERLEREIFEQYPQDKDYKCCARSMAANLRRNAPLASGCASGRIPPEWMVRADHEALASRVQQMTRRVLRSECLKEVKLDDASAELKRKTNEAGRGTNIAPPPPQYYNHESYT